MVYHHIIGVIADLEKGRDLDFMYVYSEEDAEKIKKAIEITKNELWKTDIDDALHITGGDIKLLAATEFIHMRARYGQRMMVCHFTAEEELSREVMQCLVQTLPMSRLKEAEVRI